MLLRRSIALDCLERTLPPIDEDQKLALLHAPFEGSWLSFRKRTRNVLQLSPCSLSQQRPLHLTPLHLTLHTLTSAVVGALKIRRALSNQAFKARDRAGLRPQPRLQDLANPRMARKCVRF